MCMDVYVVQYLPVWCEICRRSSAGPLYCLPNTTPYHSPFQWRAYMWAHSVYDGLNSCNVPAAHLPFPRCCWMPNESCLVAGKLPLGRQPSPLRVVPHRRFVSDLVCRLVYLHIKIKIKVKFNFSKQIK